MAALDWCRVARLGGGGGGLKCEEYISVEEYDEIERHTGYKPSHCKGQTHTINPDWLRGQLFGL